MDSWVDGTNPYLLRYRYDLVHVLTSNSIYVK